MQPANPTSDEQLMLDFQQGARDAFSELFRRYREPVYGFFRRRLRDVARAEELAQETFLAVLRAASRYQPRALFRVYLYSIALNLLSAERRKAGRETELVEETLPEKTERLSPSEVIWVRRALARLEPHEREVLMLREYEQLSYEEIAGALAVPVNTVRSRLFRARLALKEALAPAKELAKEPT